MPNQNAPFGGSLSLARIQSLVTMTTPRDGCQPVIIGAPPFVEFDLSIDGFGCLYLPSVFPRSEVGKGLHLRTYVEFFVGGGGGGGCEACHAHFWSHTACARVDKMAAHVFAQWCRKWLLFARWCG